MSISKHPRQLSEAELFDYALKTLGARAQSSGELREKLRRRAAKLGDIDTVLSKLRDLGYVNDKKYAEHFAARRVESDGFGRARVLSDLRTKRVAPTVAERAVNQAFAGIDEIELIEQFLTRKFRRHPLAEVLADEKGIASTYRKLRAAGFSSGNSIRVLKRHARAIEDLDRLADSEDPLAAPPDENPADS
jgi:regulatory protein